MAAPYRGQELSLQELFSAFSYKLQEISTDPNKCVTQLEFQRNFLFTCVIAGLLRFGSMRSARFERLSGRPLLRYRTVDHKDGAGDGGRVVSSQVPDKLLQPYQPTPS